MFDNTAALASDDNTEPAVTGLVWFLSGATFLLFVWLIGSMFFYGLDVVSLDFITGEAEDAGRAGGISAVLVSTLWIVGIAIGIAFPVSVAAAVFVVEYLDSDSIFGRWVIGSLDVLAAVPSVIFGLFGNAFFCQMLGFGYSLIAGALTLVCMILPVTIKASMEGLMSVPNHLRAAGTALALRKPTLLWHVILPAALPGIISGALLGLARALAETAALLFTSGYVLRMPESPLDSGRTISIHIYDLAMNVPGGDKAAYGSATVLVLLLIVVNVTVAGVGKYARNRTMGV